MSAVLVKTSAKLQAQLQSIPPMPWWDPQSVLPNQIRRCIQILEAACREDSPSADFRTWVGMVHAVSDDFYESIDALRTAMPPDPTHVLAQLKFVKRARASVQSRCSGPAGSGRSGSRGVLELAKASQHVMTGERYETD